MEDKVVQIYLIKKSEERQCKKLEQKIQPHSERSVCGCLCERAAARWRDAGRNSPYCHRWSNTAPCVAFLLRKGLFACRFSPLRLINIASFSRRIISAVSKDSQFAKWAGDLVAEASQAAEQEHESVLVKQAGDRFCREKVCSVDKNSNLLVKKLLFPARFSFPRGSPLPCPFSLLFKNI